MKSILIFDLRNYQLQQQDSFSYLTNEDKLLKIRNSKVDVWNEISSEFKLI